MAGRAFNTGIKQLVDGTIDWTAANIDVLLVNGSYTHDPDAANIGVAGIAGNEVTTAGYARQDLATPTLTQDDANDRVVYDAADVAGFTGMTTGENVKGSIVFLNSGAGDATSIPLFYNELAAPTDAAVISGWNWAASGIGYYQI